MNQFGSLESTSMNKERGEGIEMTTTLCNEWSMKRLQRQTFSEAMRMRVERFH